MSGLRSALVRLLKIALPVAALLLIAALFAFSAVQERTGLDLSDFTFEGRDGLRLTRPRFAGATDDGQPFRLSADWALPDAPDPSLVELGPLRGVIEVAPGRSLGVAAQRGAFRPQDRTLRLEGDVTLTLNQTEARLTMSSLSGDLDAETLTGEGPVRGAGRGATLRAGAMRATRKGGSASIRFEDRVRVTIDPAAREAATDETD